MNKVERAPVHIRVRHFWDSRVCDFGDCDHVATHVYLHDGEMHPLCGPHWGCVQRIVALDAQANARRAAQRGQYATTTTQAFGYDGGPSGFVFTFGNVNISFG